MQNKKQVYTEISACFDFEFEEQKTITISKCSSPEISEKRKKSCLNYFKLDTSLDELIEKPISLNSEILQKKNSNINLNTNSNIDEMSNTKIEKKTEIENQKLISRDLIECCVDILQNKPINPIKLSKLNNDDILTFIIILYKKSYISESFIFNINDEFNQIFFLNLLKNFSFKNNINCKSLEESIMNKVLRKCFDHWHKFINKNKNGKCEFNLKFFEYLFEDMATAYSIKYKKSANDMLNQLIKEFKKKSQMNRKKRIKKIKKMAFRKTKFMNLVLRDHQLSICKKLMNYNKLFLDYFNQYKNIIYKEYELLNDLKEYSIIERNICLKKFKNKNEAFYPKIKQSLLNSIYKIKEFQNSSNFQLDGLYIKKQLRSLKFPFSFNEIKLVLNSFVN